MSKEDNFLEALYPKSMAKKEFQAHLKELKEFLLNNKLPKNIKGISNMNNEEIFEHYGYIPYYFKSEVKFAPSIKDVLNMYTLIQYLINELNNEINNKEVFRKEVYLKFFSKETDDTKKFLYQSVNGDKNKELFKDIQVDLVKGSIYKIKQYFLENNKIKDIRGASSIIDALNKDYTLDYLEKNYIKECSLYCGGGNVFLLVPKGKGKLVCEDLEKEYTKVALTVKNAFEWTSCSLNEFFMDYSNQARKANNKLEERKKIKVYPINPDNDLKNINIKNENIKIDFKNKTKSKNVCKLCGIRDAVYVIDSPNGDIEVCPSCLRKNKVGRNKAQFFDEFERYLNITMKNKNNIKNITDVSDSQNYSAVVYADGNNMGNVIRKIKNPFQQMYFSRILDRTTKICVYKSIYDVMGEQAKFEAIALGGDDIFIILPANVSLDISTKIIEKFDKAFDNKMTMSVGVCISKDSTPIQNMFKISQSCLKNAKKYLRKNKEINEGTIDVIIMEGISNVDLQNRKSCFPMSCNQTKKAIEIIRKMKRDSKNIKISQIYKLKYAYNNMTEKEFQLFYLYQQARHSNAYTKYINEMFNVKEGYFAGLILTKDEKGQEKVISPWNDIVILWDYTEGVIKNA
ncbi:hypothetical protein CLOACE_04630 [Clostridium acetireducens DSM 10703]|uniref:GGDEF domain-containing protein n=1 Tax=Clostridium acetireducens DSM 10703 TaxID=1121290 RepID=A0A1E8F0U6_9CLOT|nr:hypothetical protein [Clostridium acetireducens]OFI07058.1 hypothetical protein CLOACE_04630 [Clostridium acetireducens DSM 10703]